MPSQKDNRNEFADQAASENENDRQAPLEESQALDIDAVSELSQEEIERLLSQGAEEAQARSRWQPEEEEQEDVLDMLEDTQDDNLQDIQEMLQKSDRNEAIDSSSEDQEDPYGESPADKLLADIEEAREEAPVDGKARKAMEKERKAQEKARQREEKAARKKAAKAEKQAKKNHRKGGSPEQAQEASKSEDANEIKEYDLLLDKDLLDSIVSDAGNLGREEKEQTPVQEAAEEAADDSDAIDVQRSVDRTEGEASMERTEASDNGSQNDIMEVDMDEVDAFIPDVSDAGQEEPKGGKKGGLVSKLITMLMEEDESENEDMPLSEENQEIIRDLDDEKSSAGKNAKKKAKKPAKKKEKKKKAPKPQKPKKAKKPKEKEPYVPGRRITFKKALPVILLGATVGAVLFIFVYVASDYSVKQQAADAFAQGDYQTCYKNLYGKKLTDEEQQMYMQAESLLYIRQKLHRYEAFLREGSEVEALDSLIQTVNDYPNLLEYASQWAVLPETEQIYASMLRALFDKYGLTEEQARAIAAIKSNIEYTRTVTALAGGEAYGGSGAVQETDDSGSQPEEDSGEDLEGGTEELPDELPEESELEDGDFVDN